MFSADRHVRIERVALEHHGDVAVTRIGRGDVLVVDQHTAGGRRVEAGENAQRGALARAGRAEQGEELARLDVEIDALQRGELAVHLDDVAKTDLTLAAHRRPPPLTAPTVRPFTICF